MLRYVSPTLAVVIVITNDSPKCKIPLPENDEVFTLTFTIFGKACEICPVDKYRFGKKYNEKVICLIKSELLLLE